MLISDKGDRLYSLLFDHRFLPIGSLMKIFIFLLFMTVPISVLPAIGVKGRVESIKDCSGPVMVWLSVDKDSYKERLLLMHTEVPVGGSFQFYLKPGNYQLRASDEKGCEFFKKIKINNKVSEVLVKLVKK